MVSQYGNYYIPSNEVPTIEEIHEYIKDYETTQLARLNRLFNWYQGKTDFYLSPKVLDKEVDNRIKSTFPRQIVHYTTDFLHGKGVKYESNKAKSALLESIQKISQKNKEHIQNHQSLLYASIMGRGYQLNYFLKGEFRFKAVDPREVITLSTREEENKYAIRFYYSGTMFKKKLNIEVYDKDFMTFYVQTDKGFVMDGEPVRHTFGMNPIQEVYTDVWKESDFEPVMDYIDAYSKHIASEMNERVYQENAILLFSNVPKSQNEFGEDVTGEAVNEAVTQKHNTIYAENDMKGGFIEKKVDWQWFKYYGENLEEKILSACSIPNKKKIDGLGQMSGKSLKIYHDELEKRVEVRKECMHDLIMNRITMITNFMYSQSVELNPGDIEFEIQGGRLDLESESLDEALKLKQLGASDETVFGAVSKRYIESPQVELKRIKEQNQNTLQFEGLLPEVNQAMEEA